MGVVERSILHYTNKERRGLGRKALKGHSALIKAARGHSRYMARTGSYSHTGAKGSSPFDRTKAAGYFSPTGENIWNVMPQRGGGGTWKSRFRWKSEWQLGRAAVISWMNSPGHRQNLLSTEWKHIGVGVARGKRGRYYLTQNFGTGIDAMDVIRFSPLLLLMIGIVGGLLAALGKAVRDLASEISWPDFGWVPWP